MMDDFNKNTKSQLISINGDRKYYPIKFENFSNPLPKNFKGDREYLVIGFDTEYQRIEVDEEKEISDISKYDNEVLSYQYSVMIVDSQRKYSDKKINGIVLPKSTNKNDRLTLSEFVNFVIGHFIFEYSDIKIPNEVYLVAHFTRADIPGFKDFKEDENNQRHNLNLENIRNTFVNVKQDIVINLIDERYDDMNISLNVKVRDTLTLAPTGKGKLEDLGEVLNFKKIRLHKDDTIELTYKKNMKRFMYNDWEKFKKYAIRDAEICTVYTDTMIHLYKEYSGKFKLPITLTQIGVDLIQKYWMERGIDVLDIVGKEEVRERYWSKRYNRYVTQKKKVNKKKLHFAENFFTECYHGGRNEQFWFGPTYSDIWYDYDLSSAYPSAMGLIGKPNWDKIRPIKDIEELLFQKENPKKYRYAADLVFAEVYFEFPDNVRFPVLPVRTENGLIFPKKGYSSTHLSEIILSHKLGAKLRLETGYEIENERHGFNKGIERPFKEFTKICVDNRKEHPKGTLKNLFWKELVNSTYGKTAQGLRERRIYDLRDAETKRLEQSKITNPVYASFITSFCRGTLSEIMNNLPKKVDIFSVTTDGFLTTATPHQMEEATKGTLCRYYKSSKRFLSNTDTIYEVKHIVKRPLGWRTRGQSTIEPSNRNDWSLTDTPTDSDKIENCYVLAKGGIKLSHLLSKKEETHQINKLFFQRIPNQKLKITLGMGIRDMYESGLDFVDRTMIKKLSMEFDWKRRPHYVGEVDINIPNIDCDKHIFFSTKPWEDINQFNKVRQYWEEYNNDTQSCLKTLKDYDDWKDYLNTKLSSENPLNDKSVGTYLRKKDGLKNRIRQQIVIAHNLQKGGTHTLKYKAFGDDKIFPSAKLKSNSFSKYLSKMLDYEVSVGDVYNDRKKRIFKSHQIPHSEQSLYYLTVIKNNLFPKLNINEFLSKRGEFDIESCELKDCYFSNKLV